MKAAAFALLFALLAWLVPFVAGAFDLQGHRGARGLSPENTLAGFARALSLGVSTLELDVGVSADGVVVVRHDSRLNPALARRPGGAWLDRPGPPLHSLSVARIKTYDVGRIDPESRYAKRFPDQVAVDGARVPTLAEVVALTRKAGNEAVRFNVETKLRPAEPGLTLAPEPFAEAVVAVLRQEGVAGRAAIQSFDWRTLAHVRRIAPEILTVHLSAQQEWLDNIRAGEPGPSPWTAGLDVDDHAGSVPRLVAAAGGAVWSPYHRDLDREALEEAHRLGLAVVTWTVNEPARMAELIALGVDGIITDYPDRLRRVAAGHGLALPEPTPVEP